MTELTKQNNGFLANPKDLQEAMKYAELIAKSSIVPDRYRGKAGDVLISIQMGSELGLPPMQSLQGIAVINGTPSIYGDALIAIVRRSSHCESIKETYDAATQTATCNVKRRGEEWEVRTFSVELAKQAGLWGKKGPWTQYPQRMLQMRARSWALRDVFPDVLAGMQVAEEARDLPAERDVTPPPETSSEALKTLTQQAEPACNSETGEEDPAETLQHHLTMMKQIRTEGALQNYFGQSWTWAKRDYPAGQPELKATYEAQKLMILENSVVAEA